MYSIKRRILLFFTVAWVLGLAACGVLLYANFQDLIVRLTESLDRNTFTIEQGQELFEINSPEFLEFLFVKRYYNSLALMILVGIVLWAILFLFLNHFFSKVFLDVEGQFFSLKSKMVVPQELGGVVTVLKEQKVENYLLQEKNKQFQAYASHELRNELASMRSVLYQENIVSGLAVLQLDLMDQTIADLLILSYNLEDVVLEKVDVILVLASVIDKLDRSGDVSYCFDKVLDFGLVMSKENWVYRLFYNLVDNALRYRVESSNVTVTASQIMDAIVIRIENKSMNKRDEINGHGIGLKLVRHVVDVLLGTCYYEVRKDKWIAIVSIPCSLS